MKTQRQPPIFLLSLLLFTTVHFHVRAADSSSDSQSNSTDYIRTNCVATLYPDICYTSLSRYASAIQKNPERLARVAIGVSLSRARHMAAYVSNLSRQADYGSDPRAAAALHDCFSNFGDAVDEIRGSLKQMRQLGTAGSSEEAFRFQMSNVQTWMSAALTDEDTCTDGFEDVADGPMKSEVCQRAADAKKFVSNALALVNNYAAKGMA
ncbi:21 kDa protein precursor, putative [Ricinus communis]|uniref:21 kDa protein, putative n=1 Tax=Ricinus communis TaxID=3988 RepID=B9SP61_RICCO|nr:21 kDa protein precursor, putative [Ricinus communis]|eukprot:XP_002527780.1 21 kDa protein [Ricinus communis]